MLSNQQPIKLVCGACPNRMVHMSCVALHRYARHLFPCSQSPHLLETHPRPDATVPPFPRPSHLQRPRALTPQVRPDPHQLRGHPYTPGGGVGAVCSATALGIGVLQGCQPPDAGQQGWQGLHQDRVTTSLQGKDDITRRLSLLVLTHYFGDMGVF